MTDMDAERLTGLYETRFAEFGLDVRSVGWGSIQDQQMRFEILCRGIDLRGKRVLDLGCGLGDFVPWADERFGGDYEYHGMDISASLVQAAKGRYGSAKRKFSVETLEGDRNFPEYDVVIVSGAFTFKVSDNMELMRGMLRRAWSVAREAVSCNFMSTYCDFQLEKNFHYHPEGVFTYAKSLSRFVNLIHDYELYEFTVQIFRDSKLKRIC